MEPDEFELIPAIDLKGGKCVRLQEGVASRVTEYGDDPVAMALHWQSLGATRLHVVDLDGAFTGNGAHQEIAGRIFKAMTIPVQFGGGLRSLEEVSCILALGAARAIIGTAALETPDMIVEAVRQHGARVIVGIDAREGKVAVRGWVRQSATSAVELAVKMKRLGVERIVYTDISRDGMLTGANVQATAQVARETGIRVIASGGVSSLEDVRRIWEERKSGIEGVVLGRALYEGSIDFCNLRSHVGLWSRDAC